MGSKWILHNSTEYQLLFVSFYLLTRFGNLTEDNDNIYCCSNQLRRLYMTGVGSDSIYIIWSDTFNNWRCFVILFTKCSSILNSEWMRKGKRQFYWQQKLKSDDKEMGKCAVELNGGLKPELSECRPVVPECLWEMKGIC